MPRVLKNNGLTIVLMLLFAASILGQWLMGWRVENEELSRHGEAAITLGQYATNPNFISTVFENWESEFLQMSAYVVLTAILIQKGSAESNPPGEPPRDADLEQQAKKPGAPRILRAGAAARWLYAHSLGLALFLLFIASFVLHWLGSAAAAAEQAKQHGEAALPALAYLGDPQL